ncbi:MAG TPA: lytic murein transglycosylase [Candidatus Paceibacterota bacterium]|nr:lytic murein transglycosylase [Candidatus Paceibacterota bacterium]
MGARLLFAALLLSTIGAIAPSVLFAQSTDATAQRRAELQRQLNSVESQIAATNSVITKLQGEGASLQRDINILDGEIKKAKLQVQATDIAIQALASNITVHSRTISTLTEQLGTQKEALAEVIRKTREYDDYSLVEVAFSAKDVSEFFGDLDSYAAINAAIDASSKRIISTRESTSQERDALETQKSQHEKLKQLKVAEQRKVQEQEVAKQKLLDQTKGQEAAYQQVKAMHERTAAQIRAELFALAGGGGAIPFGTAVEHAKTASRLTGVRPALILAILSQESDLGRNVGQCLITSLETGDGKGKNTGTPFSGVMKVPRDTVPFKRIMDALGQDWSTTAVSCPQPGGYGGAMGPTQFIPSTWEMYEGRIKSALGVAASNPWNSLHAITATGFYLADVGAAGGAYQAEHTAAARYYAGGNWATAGQVYANSVMGKAAAFQKDIDTLNGN